MHRIEGIWLTGTLGRMSPAGAGIRPADMAPLCPSSVPVKLGDTWLDKMVIFVLQSLLLLLLC